MLLIIIQVLAIGHLFRSLKLLQAEIGSLRHENAILRRRAPKRLHLTNLDRLLLVWVHWLWPEQARHSLLVTPERCCQLNSGLSTF